LQQGKKNMVRGALLFASRIPMQRGNGSGRYQGIEFQRGHGIEFQRGYGIEFQRGYGVKFGGKLRFYRVQNGGGRWSWIARLIGRIGKKVAPSILSGAKTVGKQLLSSAADQTVNKSLQFLDDVVSGENVLNSAKQRFKEGSSDLIDETKNQLKNQGLLIAEAAKRKLSEYQSRQEGSGEKKRKPVKKESIKKRKTSKPFSCKEVTSERGSFKLNKCSKLPYKDIYSV
jgi:hypothetical protein